MTWKTKFHFDHGPAQPIPLHLLAHRRPSLAPVAPLRGPRRRGPHLCALRPAAVRAGEEGEAVTLERCPVCQIPFLPGDRAAWCKWRTCTLTQQREPTEAQRRLYRMDESGHPATREGNG